MGRESEAEFKEREQEGVRKEEEGEKDLEIGEEVKEKVILENKINTNGDEQQQQEGRDFHVSMIRRLNPSNPLRVVLNNSGASRVSRVANSGASGVANGGALRVATPPPPPPPPQSFQPRYTPTPQQVSFLLI